MYLFFSKWMAGSDVKAGTGWWARHKSLHEELREMSRDWQQHPMGDKGLGGRR